MRRPVARGAPPRHGEGRKGALLPSPWLGQNRRQGKVSPILMPTAHIVGLHRLFPSLSEHFPARLLASDHSKLDQLSPTEVSVLLDL
eukprot:877494-Alexandrium_andersonii.AAC.1